MENSEQKVFAIATKQHIVYGHNDSQDELLIKQKNAYMGDYGFNPLFTSKDSLIKYAKENNITNYEIVKLDLI